MFDPSAIISREKLDFLEISIFSPGNWKQLAMSVGVLIVLYLILDYQSYKEISWKEFYNDFLEPGIVSISDVEIFSNPRVSAWPRERFFFEKQK